MADVKHFIVLGIFNPHACKLKPVEPREVDILNRCLEAYNLRETAEVPVGERALNGWQLKDQEGGNQQKKNTGRGIGEYFNYSFFDTLQVHLP